MKSNCSSSVSNITCRGNWLKNKAPIFFAFFRIRSVLHDQERVLEMIQSYSPGFDTIGDSIPILWGSYF